MFTTSAIGHVVDRAGRRLRRGPVERRRAARLADHAGRAARIDRAKNRADVLRILDFVEDDDQRRAVLAVCARSSRVASVRRSTSATTPWCAPRFAA